MPRKVQPRWGDDGAARIPDFTLSADELVALAGSLGLNNPAAIAELKPTLEWLGSRYGAVLHPHPYCNPRHVGQSAAAGSVNTRRYPKLGGSGGAKVSL